LKDNKENKNDTSLESNK